MHSFDSPRKAFLLLFAFAVLVFGFVYFFYAPNFEGYDERTYTGYMKVLNTYGFPGIREAVKRYPTDILPPSPLRILYVFAGSLTCDFSDSCGPEMLALISLLSGIAAVLVSFIFFNAFLLTRTAFFASGLIALSPLGLHMSLRALQDSFFALIVISAILFYHYCWIRGKRSDFVIFGLLLAAGFLTKESMLFLYPVFFAAGVYYYYRNGMKTTALKLLAPLGLAPLVYLAIISWVAGGFDVFITHYASWIPRADKIDYAVHFQQGPWFRYLSDFMLLSPVTFLLAVLGMALPVTDAKDERGRTLLNIYFLGGFIVFGLMSVQNVRLVLFLDIFLRALAVIGTVALVEKVRDMRYRLWAIAILAGFIILVDARQFFQIFVISETYDPVTSNLIAGNGMVK